jgi:hypothetical protein
MENKFQIEGEQEMAIVRTQLKGRRITYAMIAHNCHKTAGWVGEVLRGNFPHYHAYHMPKNIAVAIERLGIELPERFRWPKTEEEPPTERQLSYLNRLTVNLGTEVNTPTSKKEASELISKLLGNQY